VSEFKWEIELKCRKNALTQQMEFVENVYMVDHNRSFSRRCKEISLDCI
jgi:hypothetical protein